MISEASVSHPVHGEGGGGLGYPLPLEADTLTSPPPQYWHLVAATAAVGTHPTGIHSCYRFNGPGYRISANVVCTAMCIVVKHLSFCLSIGVVCFASAKRKLICTFALILII